MPKVTSGKYAGRNAIQSGGKYYIQAGRARIEVPKKNIAQNNNTSQTNQADALRQQMQTQQAAIDKQLAAAEKALEEEKKAAEEAARNRQIDMESTRARELALANQTSIGQELDSTAQSVQSSGVPSNQSTYQASGYSAPKTDAAKSTTGARVTPDNRSALAAATKTINEESGGTNRQLNESFSPPNTAGLVFGGA